MAERQPLNRELSKIFNELWDADVNRFVPGKDYTISLQGKAGFVQQGSNVARDSASEPLFHNVNEQRLKNTETYSTFISLLDNYETSTGIAELVTPEETAENNRFLDAVLKTDVMELMSKQYIKQNVYSLQLTYFTSANGISSQIHASALTNADYACVSLPMINGETEHTKCKIQRPNSCGFEHVFVGETKRGHEILGLHNWVQFYLQEKLKHIDYKGYVARKNKSRPDEDDQVLSLQFSWKGLVKPVGSTFIGVSPEFEFALYTIIFLESSERVTRQRVRIEEYELEIVVYRHGRCIGSAYPVLLSSNNEDLY